ncbi:MAG: DUF4920 domain-containing protein [Planctomycetes bacterium]|nr:DUF4920 domain-containing protein [Planctomycetota bacterium]
MKVAILASLLLAMIFLPGCDSGKGTDAQTGVANQEFEGDHTDCAKATCDAEGAGGGDATEAAQMAKDDPAGTYGMGLTLEDRTPISAILAKPESFEGQRVLVQGKAVSVCKKRGCWVEVGSDEPFESIRVKVTDGEIVFPLSCLGNVIQVEGIVEKVGEAPDCSWRIRGLGASI